MRIINSTPANGGTITVNQQLILTFDKPIKLDTVTNSMFYIEQNGKEVGFQFTVEQDKIKLTVNTNVKGKLFLLFTPFDYIANKQLTSTDGEKCYESYYLEFTVELQQLTNPVEPGSSPQLPVEQPEQSVSYNITSVKLEYNLFVFTNQMVIRFEKNIKSDFNMRIVIDKFDGDSKDDYIEVTKTSEFAKYNDNVVIITFDQLPVNSIIYVQIMSIEFEDDTFGLYEFVLFGRLVPFINAIQIKRLLGTVSLQIRDEDVYYAIFKLIVKLQFAANKQIIGVSQLEPQERVFITEYLKLELIKLLQTPSLSLSNVQMSVGGFSLQLGNNIAQQANIDKLQEDIVRQFILFKPTVLSRSISYDKSIHSKALKLLELYERYFTRAVFSVTPFGYQISPGLGYAGYLLNAEI